MRIKRCHWRMGTQFVLSPIAVTLALGAGALHAPASAQSLQPMRGEYKSVSDQFAVRVFPGNPYAHRMLVEVHVYDDAFREIDAQVYPREVLLASQDSRSVMVVVPFEGRAERRVRICAESLPNIQSTTRLRTQVCGKFIARQLTER
jgi:hypothetical protein